MNSILLCVCLALVSQSVSGMDWDEYKAQHNRSFLDLVEDGFRRTLFEARKELIETFNRLEAEEAGYFLAINEFSDRTEEEMSKRFGFKLPTGINLTELSSKGQKFLDELLGGLDGDKFLASSDEDNLSASASADGLPASVDWRNVEGRVGPVKDQGQCGSCWAHSAAGALEGQMTAQGYSLIPLSEQNLVDCRSNQQGCDGGWMYDAWDDIANQGGIMSQRDYPYQDRAGSCRFDRSRAAFTDTGAAFLREGDEAQLKSVVARFGPVSVSLDAGGSNFGSYGGGVYSGDNCRSDTLTHAILIVGYGTDAKTGKDYWIGKNSWGTGWGEQGYIKFHRNANNYCGIASHAMIPTFN